MQKRGVYYNEFDPYAAEWLRNLIAAGHLPAGDVDTRSIVDVHPSDVTGYISAHFFAGIGGWALAARLAGLEDNRPLWTGSCPCQGFSTAGKQLGFDDPRHLWPAWFRLIRECRPATIYSEQVSNAIRLGWLDLVFSDLERENYAVGATVLPACSVGAPHLRNRLWFVADSLSAGRTERRTESGFGQIAGRGILSQLADSESEHDRAGARGARRRIEFTDGRNAVVADASNTRQRVTKNTGTNRIDSQPLQIGRQRESGFRQPERSCDARQLADRNNSGLEIECEQSSRDRSGTAFDHFGETEWLQCSDGKSRATQSVLFEMVAGLSDSLGFVRSGASEEKAFLSPLTKGSKSRVGRLKAYGNSIVPQVGAEFIKACM